MYLAPFELEKYLNDFHIIIMARQLEKLSSKLQFGLILINAFALWQSYSFPIYTLISLTIFFIVNVVVVIISHNALHAINQSRLLKYHIKLMYIS